MMRTHEQTQLHFVGIGGIGMSGIAEVLLNQGYVISGSDLSESETTRRLQSLGAKVFIGHAAENISGASVVVISSAVSAKNPEVIQAKATRVPVIPRAEMLAEIMRGRTGIAIAGTHGKTTTTSMLGTVLTVAGTDPTLIIGGKVDSLGGNAKLGRGNLVLAEADESDGSFLHLPATFAVITNIDNDHLDHFGSVNAIEDAFVNLVAKVPFYGLAAVCGDDPGVKRCMSRFTKPFMTYGFADTNDFYATDVQATVHGSRFRVRSRGEVLGDVELQIPGRHNILNALAAIVIGRKLDLGFDTIADGLQAFQGVRRRFDVRWKNESSRQMIIDDYGHHPTEIRATLAAARSIWKGRIITVFQPHRFTRTLHCQNEFPGAFEQSDVVILTDIYAAGEEPITGVSSEILAKQIEGTGTKLVVYAGSLELARKEVIKRFSPGDLVICLGAGSITKLADELSKLQTMELANTK